MAVPKERKYTSDEFFELIPETNERCELIDGDIVYRAAPSIEHHDISGGLYFELRNFIKKNNGKFKPFISPVDVKLDWSTVVQPDVFVVCVPEQADNKRIYGAPDFVIEVLSTNRDDDLVRKYALYKEHGVREYWIVDPKFRKTVVYFFEKSDLPDIYTFDTPIPVGIFGSALSITIADII